MVTNSLGEYLCVHSNTDSYLTARNKPLFRVSMAAVPVLGTAENPGPINPETKAKTNLIVNYLPPTLSEDDFRLLFSTVGEVQSHKLIRDKDTNASLGYGFINYGTAAEAERAIRDLNGLALQDKTIKVSYARPSSSAIKNANVYVANLPPTFTTQDLDAMFRVFGEIITSKILIDQTTGMGRGVGFVRFDKYSEAETAITALNGQEIPGSPVPLTVKFANPPKLAVQNQQQALQTGGSPIATMSSAIATLQQQQQQAKRNNIPSGGGPMRHSLASMRFNPISSLGASPVATAAAAAAAAQLALSNPTLSLSLNSTTTTNAWCLFVYNIPEECEDSLLYQLFSPFGAISSVNIIRDLATKKTKRYGFVNMVNYEEAAKAISHLNGYTLDGKQLQVSFKSTKSK